ncbi:BA75_00686T0 [Komagataella pastoris]|uniref:BA75_00686T0 n=1 Tax=Komagataella pastoris TaxID=4922 RepID=A0A1B2J654_PICPA|nr:BA75_00686T0 [Komagataella pastoris]
MRAFTYLRQAQEILIKANKGNPTGLTGLFQHPSPRPTLITLYKATLKNLEEKIPKESVYRTAVEAFTKERLSIVENNEVIEDIEKKIGSGLVEELIVQANEEYDLIDKMAEWKAWEELEEKPLDDQWTYFGKKL